jgi:hypothetical protein
VLQVRLRRGLQPAVEPLTTGTLGWHPVQASLHSDADLERLERELEALLGDRVGRDLVLLEQRGSLSLEAHRRYDALLERLEAQLLRLKRRGHCSEAPGEAELEALTRRPGDPLIAQVAAALQQELGSAAAGDADAQEPLRRALAELHRAVLQAEG